tara:strand:+ start:263 stop:478 length:216 start_codon:yes stop_codon:yes gene_type:complete
MPKQNRQFQARAQKDGYKIYFSEDGKNWLYFGPAPDKDYADWLIGKAKAKPHLVTGNPEPRVFAPQSRNHA